MNAATPPSAVQHARVSSHDLPARHKASALRELLGRELMRVDLLPADADARPIEAFRYDAAVSTLGSGTAYAHVRHTPVHYRRTAELMHDGLDDLFLTTTHSRGGYVLRHRQGDIAVPSGSIALLSKARLHDGITPWGGTSTCIQVPRAALARLLPRLEEAPLHVFTPGTPGADSAALALAYAGLLTSQGTLAGAPLASAVAHLHELIAGAIAPRWAAGQPPGGEAQRAPLLALVQQSIRARLEWPGLDLAHVARLHHTTPRQLQRLFASQGTCFTDFLAEARMQRARALLASPAQRHRRVLDIALDCGFDNLSAFGRAFRRRFGITPGDARQAA
ncbi:MAG: helix-turn-helix transcriptional regulator [Ottowia sp.]|uniref:helix-turn-helix transcriptional regulator n=1 Tax=Ottowia sp. TaxID=1898956 RepID=UPI0039E3DD0B